MSTSYNGVASCVFPVPVVTFLYPDTCAFASVKESKPAEPAMKQEAAPKGPPAIPAEEVETLLNEARAQASNETERRLQSEYEARSAMESAKIKYALELFVEERKTYFSRVEAEVVQLALAISAKILHREAQVDPMLVSALVRVAVDKLHDGSSVSVRVSPEVAGRWSAYLANPLNGSTIAILEDAHLGPNDCILETDLGSANFSIDAQLKEVEQGFFDLLAQRPVIK